MDRKWLFAIKFEVELMKNVSLTDYRWIKYEYHTIIF